MRSRTRTTSSLAVLAAVASAVLLAGCGGGGGGGASGTAAAPRADNGGGTAAESSGGGTGSTAGGSGKSSRDAMSARVLPFGRDLVYRGELVVRTRDVATASSRAQDITTSSGGLVFSEDQTSDAGSGRVTRSMLTLRVPPAQFDPVLDRLAGLGTVRSRQSSAEDVTGQVVDVTSRLASQRRSVARIQVLMDKATSVAAIVAIESELARREADLESLEAQQKRLADTTSMATITLALVAPEKRAAPPTKDHIGFLTGLADGWNAFVAVVLVLVTAVGALLPFVIALALLGLPVLWFLRGRRHEPVVAPTPSDG